MDMLALGSCDAHTPVDRPHHKDQSARGRGEMAARGVVEGVVRQGRFHAWVARGDFQDPLHLFLLRGTPLRDLSGLRGSDLRDASRANGVFIAEERLRLRGLLQAYAETGANPFGDACAFLHDFTDGGEASRRGGGEAREAAILQLLLDAGSAENPIGGPDGL